MNESQKSCCHGDGHHHHGEVEPPAGAKYFCPMCPGVESDEPGDCPKCGMALERNPLWQPGVIYTCPMHPEIEQDHPGDCPICGMALEPKGGAAADDDEIRPLARNHPRRDPAASPDGPARHHGHRRQPQDRRSGRPRAGHR